MKQIERIPTPPDWENLKYHELSSLVEFGTGIDMDQLAADMRDNGYDEAEPIILLDGKILDGRHRHKGAIMADKRPTFAKFIGDNPLNYVKKKILRQHLNESQRAMLAAKLASLPKGRPSAENASIEAFSQSEAADTLNVSRASVQRAAEVLEHGTPELQEAVSDGTVTVSDAAKVVSEPPEVQREAVAEVKAGTSPTVAAAIVNDPNLCFQCNRNRRTGQPLRKNCPDCPKNAKPAEKPPPPKPDSAKPIDVLFSAVQTLSYCANDPEAQECVITKPEARALIAELERLQNNQKRSTGFVKPTVEEVAAYCKERKNKIDAQAFVDFYDSKGWLVGKVPMKDWQAAVRNWEKMDKERQGEKQKAANGTASKRSKMGRYVDEDE